MSSAPNNNFSKAFKINLLVSKEEQTKLYARLLKWLLSSGRYIVIFVEILVISAFVYRYKLDADLADVKDQIKEQIPYLQSLKTDESLIKQTQFQLATIKQNKKDSPDFSELFLTIARLTPRNMKLTNITFDRSQTFPKTSLSITGQTPSNLELTAFLKALQGDPNFTDVSLSNISFEGQTIFTVTGSLSQKGGKSS